MHFWIDKRSHQGWAGRKMATPVHRFQAIEAARRPRPPPAARCPHSLQAGQQEPPLGRVPPPLLPPPRSSGRLKCGLWASLALLSFLLASARFFSTHKGSGLEVLYVTVCALLLVLLCCGCIVSLCSAAPPPRGCFAASPSPHLHHNHSAGVRSALIEVPEEEEAWPQQPLLAGGGTEGQQPPPYHIAVWLPQPEPEQHPPSYDAATR